MNVFWCDGQGWVYCPCWPGDCLCGEGPTVDCDGCVNCDEELAANAFA